MSLHATIFLLGIFLILLPYLGFPQTWDNVFIVLTGLSITVLSFFVRAEGMRQKRITGEYAGGEGAFKESVPSVGKEQKESEDMLKVAVKEI
jgi:hypothetical protein